MRISGGFKLTLVNELAVVPLKTPSRTVVTTVTPLAQRASASLNSCASTGMNFLPCNHHVVNNQFFIITARIAEIPVHWYGKSLN
jgi:hypothetical protein